METFTKDQVDLIKNQICPGLTDDEFKLFLYTASKCKLDPLQKQIYAIKRGGRMTIQTSIDGLRLIAERTGKYAPGKDTEFIFSDKGGIMGAKVYVKKMTPDGTWHEVSATAFMNEYSTRQNLWARMPSVMIEKCAESRALRRAFPQELSALYSEEEMDQAHVEVPQVEQKPETMSAEHAKEIEEACLQHPEFAEKIKAHLNGKPISSQSELFYQRCLQTLKLHMEESNG